MNKILLYILTLSLAVACQDYPYSKTPLVGVADINFSVTMPAHNQTQTRAIADTDVENIDLLMFDENNKFIERIKIDEITGSASVKSFSLKLDYTPNARTFHIIANARDAADVDRVDYSGLAVGTLESVAIPNLKTVTPTDFTVNTAVMPIVMWGRVRLNNVTQSTINVADAKLLRTTAAIKIVNEAGTDFVVTNTTLSSASQYGFVAPSAYTSTAATPSTVTLPSGNPTTTNLYYWGAGADLTLYTYERKNTENDYLHILIEATYKGVPGYYKIALADQNGDYMDVVRNHRYILKIKSVNGEGCSMSDAISRPPTNLLDIDIEDKRDDIFLIEADGRNELGISVNYLELKGKFDNSTIEIAKIFATRSALTATSSLNVITDLTISAADINGLRTLTGKWNSNTYEDGIITVSDGYGLKQTITVKAVTMAADHNAANNNASVYTYRLADTGNAPWSAWIVEGATNRVRLHNQISAAGFSASDAWGFSTIESRMYTTCYIHVLKTGGNHAIVQFSCRDTQSDLRVGRIIICQD